MDKDYTELVYAQSRTPKTDYPRRLARHLMERFGMAPGQTLLDVGCGRGDFLLGFASEGLVCSGVDGSDFAAGQGVERLAICDLSDEPLPHDDETFDVVFSKSVIEHMWDPEHFVREQLRVLKPGGLCIVMTPDWASCMPVFYEDPTHCHPYTPGALKDLLLLHGLEQVEAELFVQHPGVWEHLSLAVLADLLASFCPTPFMRRLTAATGVKFFRWSVERMALGAGRKPE
ncbi:MAG: class I SAM-dependent methyltransferase [Desulfovibrionaceae bacterium]